MSMNTPGPGGGLPPNLAGAVDLGALAAAREQQQQAQERIAQRAADPSASNAVTAVTELTEPNFQAEAVDRSFEVPVVVLMWSPRSEASVEAIGTLEQLAIADAGTWVVGTVNVDEQQQIAAAFQVQGVPTMVALIKGQPVPLVQGSIPAEDARKLIDHVVEAGKANGVAGQVQLAAAGEAPAAVAEESQIDPLEEYFDAAADAYDRQDWAAAVAAYEAALVVAPDDEDAKAGLVRVELMKELDGKDFAEVLTKADAVPNDVELAIDAANVELVSGVPAAAFTRLIEVVRNTQEDDRAAARDHLVKLFELAGPIPEVTAARSQLANALF